MSITITPRPVHTGTARGTGTAGGLHATVTGGGDRTAVYLPQAGRYGDEGRRLAEAIASSHTTHLLDLPGTGRSAAVPGARAAQHVWRAVDEHLAGARVRQVDLIGHGVGGILALSYALARLCRVLSLTLLDSGYCRMPGFPVRVCGPVGYAMPAINLAHRLLGDRLRVRLGPTGRRARPGGPRLDFEHDPAPIHPQALGVLLAAYRADPVSDLSRLRVPCLLMHGHRQAGSPRHDQVLKQITTRPATHVLQLADGPARPADRCAAAALSRFLTALR